MCVYRMLAGKRVGVGLARSATNPMLPSLFPIKEASSEPPVARSGQHPWLHPGWKTLQSRIGYCWNANCARRFRCEDNNVILHTCNLTTITYGRWSLVPKSDEVARRSPWAFKLLALCLNNMGNVNSVPDHISLYPGGQRTLAFIIWWPG